MEKLRTLGIDKFQEAFILLLRAGLWEKEVDDVSLFPLSEDEWERVISEARRQTVQALVLSGMQKLPPELMPAQQQIWKWLPDLVRIEADYRRVTSAVATSCKTLQEIGVSPILQKGLAVARFYEKPQWRVNGDVDWFVHKQVKMRDIASSLQDKGYETYFHADGSFSYEEDSVEIEIHAQMIDLYASAGIKAVDEVCQREDLEELELPNGMSITTAGPATTLLMLETHLLKHVTSVGIGLRQFCDMARAAFVLQGRYDEGVLLEAIRKAGLQRWHSLLHVFLVEVLSMPSAAWPVCSVKGDEYQQKDLEWLLNDVLRSGNFGHGSPTWHLLTRKGEVGVSHTLRQRFSRLPFAVRYASREICSQTSVLTINRIKNKLYTTYEKIYH